MIALGSVLAVAVAVAAWVVFALWNSIIGLTIGVILLDLAGAVVARLLSARYLCVTPAARSRINTMFVGVMFLGDAGGSAGATLAWNDAGWTGVCLLSGGLAVAATLLQFAARRTRET